MIFLTVSLAYLAKGGDEIPKKIILSEEQNLDEQSEEVCTEEQ